MILVQHFSDESTNPVIRMDACIGYDPGGGFASGFAFLGFVNGKAEYQATSVEIVDVAWTGLPAGRHDAKGGGN